MNFDAYINDQFKVALDFITFSFKYNLLFFLLEHISVSVFRQLKKSVTITNDPGCVMNVTKGQLCKFKAIVKTLQNFC